jgi:hypothetical protein
MADDAIKVRGWDELADGTKQLASNIDAETQTQFRAAADVTASRVRGGVPVVSGAMAASVGVEPGPPVGVGYTGGVAYAGWVDFGGGHGRPYLAGGRYLFPAIQDAEPLVVAAAELATKNEVQEMRWPTPT